MAKTALRALLLLCLWSTVPVTDAQSRASRPDCAPEDNQRLCRLYADDQAARSGPGNWERNKHQIVKDDAARRGEVTGMLERDELKTAGDHWRAAMVFQHGTDWQDHGRAHLLASQAAILDPEFERARWLVAASWDRLLVSLGEQQWFGTQYRRRSGDPKSELLPHDLGRVTDSQRKFFGLLRTKEGGDKP